MGKLSAKAMAVQKDIEKIDMVLSTKGQQCIQDAPY